MYLILPESIPSPTTIAWMSPGTIDIGTFELRSDNNNTLDVLKFVSITLPIK